MSDITVRHIRFEFPDDIPLVFIDGEPEESAMNIALSLLLPYLEPYVIRSVTAARKHVTDPRLRDELDAFAAQEGQHYRQHKRFNDVIHTLDYPRLADFESEVEAQFRRWSKTKSLRFNLGYAEGFEAMTTVVARVAADEDRSNWHPAVRDLIEWHLMEELEHRTVAFEVYQHVCGDYAYRLAIGSFAQFHLLRFVDRVHRYLLDATPGLLEAYGGMEGRRRRMKRLNRRMLRILRGTSKSWRRDYSPAVLDLPAQVRDWADRYDAMAKAN
jgi:predicted metal-dependent hydrolase